MNTHPCNTIPLYFSRRHEKDNRSHFDAFDDLDLGDGKGANRFLITSDVGQYIDKIVISGLEGVSTKSGNPTITAAYDFDSIKQASFDFVSGVPEPATWAEFILGFGLTGVMLRRRRNQTAVVPA